MLRFEHVTLLQVANLSHFRYKPPLVDCLFKLSPIRNEFVIDTSTSLSTKEHGEDVRTRIGQ
jgi:hypothetical protein